MSVPTTSSANSKGDLIINFIEPEQCASHIQLVNGLLFIVFMEKTPLTILLKIQPLYEVYIE